MKKTILAIFMSLIFVIACGEDADSTGTAKITVNGVDFNKSVACSTTPGDSLVISIGATDSDGNTISIDGDLSKDGDNYKHVDGDAFSVMYTEGVASQYSASEDDGGTFTGNFDGKVVKLSFEVDAKLNGIGTTKHLKGDIVCTPGGATD